MKISAISAIANFINTKSSKPIQKTPNLNYEIKDTISFGAKTSEETASLKANYPDMLTFADTDRTRTVQEMKKALKLGEDIKEDRDKLIVSRIPIALRDAEKFVSEHPKYEIEDVEQDLVKILILETDTDLNNNSTRSTFPTLYVKARDRYFGSVLEEEVKTKTNPTEVEIQNDPYKIVEEEELKKDMEAIIKTLPQREAKVISEIFGVGDRETKSRTDLAKDFNVSYEVIRKIEERSMRRLRHPSRSRNIAPYRKD